MKADEDGQAESATFDHLFQMKITDLKMCKNVIVA